MTDEPRHRVGREWGDNPLLRALAAAYVVFWVWMAIAPYDRSDWLLENLLVFVAVALLVGTHRRFVFSDLSYVLIFVFLVFHATGAHYTYSAVPVGDWARNVFGFSRNHYDRFVHFLFGLLIVYPMREVGLRVLHVHRFWSYLVPILTIVSAGAFYEMIEWVAARASAPELGITYVGAQGDVWDGQKDMAIALLGAVLASIACGYVRRSTGFEPYHGS